MKALSNDKQNRAQKVVFNDSGDTFATVDSSGNVFIFYLTKNRFVRVCRNVYPSSICFTERKGGLVFCGMPNKNIEVYNLQGKVIQRLKGHKHSIQGLRVNHSRGLLLSYSSDACIIWDMNSWKVYKTLNAKNVGFSCATFTPDGDSLISCFSDSTVYFWSLSDFSVEEKINLPPTAKVNRLATSIESRYLAAAGESPQIYIIPLRNKSDFKTYEIPNGCEMTKDLYFIEKSRLVFLANDDQVYCTSIEDNMKLVMQKGIPGRALNSFGVDFYCRYLGAVAHTGELYLFDLGKVLDSENKLAT